MRFPPFALGFALGTALGLVGPVLTTPDFPVVPLVGLQEGATALPAPLTPTQPSRPVTGAPGGLWYANGLLTGP